MVVEIVGIRQPPSVFQVPGNKPHSVSVCQVMYAIFDEAVVNFCEKSFSFGKSGPKWSAFNELIRVVWQNRLPLEPSEVMSVLKAHGVPKRWEKYLSDFYEKGINLLVYVKGRKPIKNKRVEPLHSSLAENER